MRHPLLLALAALVLAGGCSPEAAPEGSDAAPNGSDVAQAPAEPPAPEPLPPVSPPEPGTPGGLPDDRTPISEAPFTPDSAQGAANVVQTYYALIGEQKYAEARRLWSDGGKASGANEANFAKGFEGFTEYHAQIGAPGAIEGAAGSLYVEIPVVLYGRLKTGATFNSRATAVLRRVNNVPGATPEQLRWHIARIDPVAAVPKP